MTWEEIQFHYPHQWLLAEAIKAFSKPGRLIVEQLSVDSTFPDSRHKFLLSLGAYIVAAQKTDRKKQGC
ncbi:MAG: hypothetical protein DRI57_07655 [Deltaproteobacteria bacterium]|nr:MAG: hypothetical protein DRI57_07655 [Deltaproteobacteria bacterium]